MSTFSCFHHSYYVNVSHVFSQPVVQDTDVTDKEDYDFDIIKLQRAAKRARIIATTSSGVAMPPSPLTHTTPNLSAATAPNLLAATALQMLGAMSNTNAN